MATVAMIRRSTRLCARSPRTPVLVALIAVTLAVLIQAPLRAPGAYAAGGDIRVVSTQQQVRFPENVLFDLEVEGTEEIVEVTLYFRIRPSDIWSYTYPEVTPARRLRARFNLDVSGISYLPPGAELEYYYQIRDAAGSVLETTHETFLYVDDRFDWQSVDAGPLKIFWHDQRASRARQVAGQVEDALNEISELLGVELGRPIRGIIYNSRAEASAAFPHQSATTTEEQVFQGFAFPERGVFVGIGLQPGLIVHESAHLILREATSSPGSRVPAWVNEGFASYVEPGGQGYDRSFLRSAGPDRIPLRQMNTIPGRPGDVGYFYRKSESVVGYLLEAHGAETFRSFIGQLDDGGHVDGALTRTYGFGVDELDRRWSSSLGAGGHGGADDAGGGGLRFTGLGTMLLAVLVVAVMAVAGATYLMKWLRRRRDGSEDWDGLTEEEWEGRP